MPNFEAPSNKENAENPIITPEKMADVQKKLDEKVGIGNESMAKEAEVLPADQKVEILEMNNQISGVASEAKKESIEVMKDGVIMGVEKNEEVAEAQEFLHNIENYGKGKKASEQLDSYLAEKFPQFLTGTKEYDSKRDELVGAIRFIKIKDNPIVVEKYPNLTMEEYGQKKDEIILDVTKYNIIQETTKQIEKINTSKSETPLILIESGLKETKDITLEFLKNNPNIKKQNILSVMDQRGDWDSAAILLENGVFNEKDFTDFIYKSIKADSETMTTKANNSENYKTSRYLFLRHIPVYFLKKVAKGDEQMRLILSGELDDNKKAAEAIANDKAITESNPSDSGRATNILTEQASLAIKYEEAVGTPQNKEKMQKKYGQLINKSLENLAVQPGGMNYIRDILSKSKSIVESGLLPKENIIAVLETSVDNAKELDHSTLERNYLSLVRKLVDQKILSTGEAQVIAEKCISKLVLEK